MKVTKQSPLTGREHTMDILITQDQLDRWNNGELVQQVFDNLTDSEREFLISGIPEEEWNEYITSSEEEEYYVDDSNQYIVNTTMQPNGQSLFEIRCKDIDPDTGDIYSDIFFAYTDTEHKAEIIRSVIESDYANQTNDPNREFYIKKPN